MIVGFMHIYAVNNFQEIVEDQVKRICDSGLIQHVSRVYYCVVGREPYIIEKSKFCLLDCTSDMSKHEFFTLHHLHKLAKSSTKNFKVFYIHTKGVTKPENKATSDWREYMEYFSLNCWQWAVEGLDIADTVGVNIRYYGKHKMSRFHYSGNFWWANSHYIKTLPDLTVEGYGREVNRWDGEFWIGDGNPEMISLWDSRQHHSRQYGPSNYEGKSPKMKHYGRINDRVKLNKFQQAF